MSDECQRALSPVDAAIVKLSAKKNITELAKYFGGDESVALHIQRIAMTEIRKNPKIADCDKDSIVGAVFQSAQLGLSLDSNLQHAALIPYGGKCQLQIMYKGMLNLAYRNGKIKRITANVVKENDDFSFEIKDGHESLNHKVELNGRGKLIGAYAVVEYVGDSEKVYTVMDRDDIAKCKAASKMPTNWTKHEEEMYKKTAIKRACKYLNLDDNLSRAISLDDLADAEIDQGNQFFDGECEPVIEKKSKTAFVTEMLKEKSNED